MIPWIVTGIVATWRNNLDKESVPRAPGAADTSMPRHTWVLFSLDVNVIRCI